MFPQEAVQAADFIQFLIFGLGKESTLVIHVHLITINHFLFHLDQGRSCLTVLAGFPCFDR